MPTRFDPEVMRLLAGAPFFQGLDQATLFGRTQRVSLFGGKGRYDRRWPAG